MGFSDGLVKQLCQEGQIAYQEVRLRGRCLIYIFQSECDRYLASITYDRVEPLELDNH